MCRSINAQAEFWIKIGRLAEANPTLTFSEIVKREMAHVHDDAEGVAEAA